LVLIRVYSYTLRKESKFKKLGRLNGEFVRAFIYFSISQRKIEKYAEELIKELGTYSFRPPFQGEESHEGCRSWINALPERRADYLNPRMLALKVKSDLDSLQQKKHARNYYQGFLEGLN
jgi:hypothetical protein